MTEIIRYSDKGDCRKHRELLADLVNRLEEKNYDLIVTNMTYSVGDLEGEIDVLATRGEWNHFYEIKSGHHRIAKAKRQYARFKEAFPDIKVKGIYHDNDCYRLMR